MDGQTEQFKTSRNEELRHLHSSATVSKIWDTRMGWAMELVKIFGTENS